MNTRPTAAISRQKSQAETWQVKNTLHVQIMLLFVYTTTRKGFVIFTRRYYKLS